MGVVCLPYKTDYWKDDYNWPYNPIMYEMGMSQDQFEFLWRSFHISSVELSDVNNEQDYCYVGGNEDLENNVLAGDPIYGNQYQSQNVEDTNTNTKTNQQHNIVDI